MNEVGINWRALASRHPSALLFAAQSTARHRPAEPVMSQIAFIMLVLDTVLVEQGGWRRLPAGYTQGSSAHCGSPLR